MSFFGFRKYPTPVLKPLYPFFISGAITFYLINTAQKGMLQMPEYRDDKKNPHKAASGH